ncbi:unnamed protein product [Meganyctiphanes norvegica]|uniref:Uncharacterized protein n=1 Tax=Meganyctiphanes norvegica TaxID=48144 RepID=A0AAV2RGE4_MEGNR
MDESSASANPRSCVLPDKSLPSGSNDFANNASADKAMLPDLQETHADNAKLMSKAMPPASNNNAMNNTCVLPNISASAAILSTHEMPDLPNSSSTVFNKSLSQKNQPLRPLQEENMVVIKRASRGRAAKGDPRLVRSLDLELLEIEADEVRRQLEEEKSKNKYLSNLIDDLKRQVSEVVVDLNTEQHTDPEVGRSTSHDLSPPKTSVLPPHRPPPRPPPRTTTMHHRPPQVPNNTGSQRRMHEKDNSGSSKLGLASCSPVRSTSKSRSSAPSKIEPLFPPLIHHSPSHQDHSLPSIRNTKQRSRGRKKSQRSSETKEFSTVTTLPEVNGTKENSPKRTQEQQQLTNGSNLQEQHQHHRGGRVREHGRGRVRNRHQQQQYQQQHDQRSQGKTKEITQHEDREDNHFQGSSSLQQSHRRSSSLRRVPGTRQMQQKEQQQSPELSHYEYENCDKSVSRDVFQSCQNDKHVLDSTTDEMNSSWEQQQHQAAAVASTSVKQETDNKSEGRKGRGRHHRRGRGKSRREKAIHNQQVPNED